MKQPKLEQSDMFNDPELVKPPAGTDAGMQVDMFGNTHLVASEATDTIKEAVDIFKQHKLTKPISRLPDESVEEHRARLERMEQATQSKWR